MIDYTKINQPNEVADRTKGHQAKQHKNKENRAAGKEQQNHHQPHQPTLPRTRRKEGRKEEWKEKKTTSQQHNKPRNRIQRTENHTPYDGTITPHQNRQYTSPGLEKVLTEHLGPNNHIVKDHYRWLVSSIVYVGATDKRTQQDPEGYVSLKYELLRTILPKRQLTKIIKDLILWGVIERNGSYRNGHRSMGYRRNPHFNFGKFRLRHIINHHMHQKLDIHHGIVRDRICRRSAYAAVYRTVEALTIQERRARRKVNRDFDRSLLEDRHRYDTRMIGIDSIALHNLFHAIDPKTGRYYHSYACLARELRPMVEYEGSGLKEVDITNSQPLLLHLLLKEKNMVRPSEAVRMEKLVLTGRFYEEFNANGLDRDELKREFYRDVLFGKGLYSNDMTKLFRKKFPSYAAAIRNIKHGDHTKLAIRMQTMEAEIIFAAVERFIGRCGLYSPIVTIHDSLSTTSDYCEEAMNALYHVFKERFGIRPHLKIK